MKNPKLWIYLGLAGVMLACALAFAPYARATDKPQIIPPPKTVVVTETHHDYSAALVGAGITYWLMRRHAKRNRPPQVYAPPPNCPTVTCPVTECSVQIERAMLECIGK